MMKKTIESTMKNSASNLSIIQALRDQAAHILPQLTAALSVLDYKDISHQRMGQQDDNYHGLIRAHHLGFGDVWIKWELGLNHNSSDLDHEITVLKALKTPPKNQDTPIVITPPIVSHRHLTINISAQVRPLTILVMPYYQKGSLANQLRQPLLSNRQKKGFIVQSADLIERLHKNNWTHGDIKPSNILIKELPSFDDSDDSANMPVLLLTDFALAEHINESRRIKTAGTPAYLAPERWLGQGLTVQSDVYAFGVMMYEILTGVRPFKIDTQGDELLKEWAMQHCQKRVPTLPYGYENYRPIIDKALAKRVEGRYKSMEAVLEDLKNV